jgi:hypothetical protein
MIRTKGFCTVVDVGQGVESSTSRRGDKQTCCRKDRGVGRSAEPRRRRCSSCLAAVH